VGWCRVAAGNQYSASAFAPRHHHPRLCTQHKWMVFAEVRLSPAWLEADCLKKRKTENETENKWAGNQEAVTFLGYRPFDPELDRR